MMSLEWNKDKYSQLRQELQLPDSFTVILENIYFPLAEVIKSTKRDQPLLVSINGAQGTGKSTLTKFIHHILESEFNYKVASFSLDDFYLVYEDRKRYARQIHPLFITRGVPGTHDLNLLESTIQALLEGVRCTVPVFDKAKDERADQARWKSYSSPVDIILFEGWCVNSPVQNQAELIEPINDLEATEDANGEWRMHANQMLSQYHERIFKYADLNIMLKVPDFQHVYRWRRIQEEKLKANTPKHKFTKIMNEVELQRFIQHYERITRHTLKTLPATADFVLPINSDHSITKIVVKNEK